MKKVLRIRDLRPGDRVEVRWYPEQVIPLVGTVESVIPNASRASGTYIRTDAGQGVRIKSDMTIRRVEN